MLDSVKTLKERTKEFVEKETYDQKTLLDFNTKVFEQQEVMRITVHTNQDGAIDCSCLGTLCMLEAVPTEEMLGCKRIRVMYLDDAEKEESFEPKPDFFKV